jgi:hypothetical protein
MRTTTCSEALAARVPGPDADESAYPPAFRRIAELLLDGVTWHIGGHPHRATEVELYWNGPRHPDTFTHGDPMQRELGRWYFHRSGETYRGGTYKGLDVAIGRDDAPGGALVRGLERVDGDRARLDGPCMCVDHILALTGRPTVAALVAGWDRGVDEPADGDAPLYLTVDPAPRGDVVYAGPRVGLTLKRGVPAERARFLARSYRFFRDPARIKKGRPHLAIGLHRDGHAAADIARIVGLSLAQVERYVRLFADGRGRDLAGFVGDLGADDTCRLLGACAARE